MVFTPFMSLDKRNVMCVYVCVCVFLNYFYHFGITNISKSGSEVLFSSTSCLIAMEYGLKTRTYLASDILDKDKLEFTSPIMS